jgi:hypothetical protein
LRSDGYFDTHKEVEWELHKTAREFLLASAAACGICAAVVTRLTQMLSSVWKFFELYGDRPTKLCAQQDRLIFVDDNVKMPFIISFAETEVPDISLGMYSNITDKFTGHFSVLGRGRKWFEQCLGTHDTCTRERFVGYYPPRILVIEASLGLRLIDSQNLGGLPYATLSYCWGRNPRHLKLTPQTETSLRTGVDTASLAATFVDAMKVCTHMQIQLLWIDSLCIMQEGPQHASDWQRHLTEMCSIYENCILNISADDGENADAGCFRHRDPDRVRPIFCEQDESADEELTALYSTGMWRSSTELSALMQRGWVHQERLLSPRVLRFGASQLFWECGHLSACETLPMGFPRLESSITSLSHSVRSEEERWYTIVEEFTKAELTVTSDRLPAVGGIAKRMSFQISSPYLAGLFKNTLPYALLWQRADAWLVRRSLPYVAPSWSWASCDGSVTFEMVSTMYTARCKVEEVDLDLVSPSNPFGQLLGGWITLSGPLLEGMRIDHEFMAHGTGERWWYHEDVHLLSRSDPTTQVIFHAYFDENAVMQARDNLSYLVVDDNLHESQWPSARGLIIKPADKAYYTGHHVRMGVFEITWPQDQQPDLTGCKMVTLTIG